MGFVFCVSSQKNICRYLCCGCSHSEAKRFWDTLYGFALCSLLWFIYFLLFFSLLFFFNLSAPFSFSFYIFHAKLLLLWKTHMLIEVSCKELSEENWANFPGNYQKQVKMTNRLTALDCYWFIAKNEWSVSKCTFSQDQSRVWLPLSAFLYNETNPPHDTSPFSF